MSRLSFKDAEEFLVLEEESFMNVSKAPTLQKHFRYIHLNVFFWLPFEN